MLSTEVQAICNILIRKGIIVDGEIEKEEELIISQRRKENEEDIHYNTY
jgi:hypothetical protein